MDVARRRLQPGWVFPVDDLRRLPVLLLQSVLGRPRAGLAVDALFHEQPGHFQTDRHPLVFDLGEPRPPHRNRLRPIDDAPQIPDHLGQFPGHLGSDRAVLRASHVDVLVEEKERKSPPRILSKSIHATRPTAPHLPQHPQHQPNPTTSKPAPVRPPLSTTNPVPHSRLSNVKFRSGFLRSFG